MAFIPNSLQHVFKELGIENKKQHVLALPCTKIENGKVIWLDLGCTGISKIPAKVFSQLKDLEYLGLYGNGLKTLPKAIFHQLQNLKYLDLGENKLDHLPKGIFHGLNQLEALWLYSNNLTKFDAALLESNRKLKELNLNSNPIVKLDRKLLEILPNLERLEIALTGIKNINKHKLPPSLQLLLISRQMQTGGQVIINVLQKPEDNKIEPTDQDRFCLVTGQMGSGKSTILKQVPFPKKEGYPPQTDVNLFFDTLFGIARPKGGTTIFYELDGPTVLTWHQFITAADMIIHVVNYNNLEKEYDDIIILHEHLRKYSKQTARIIVAITHIPPSMKNLPVDEFNIPDEIKTADIVLVPKGSIIPDIGGNRKIILKQNVMRDLFLKTLE